MGVEDRIEVIIEVKKVLSKRSTMLNLEEKCHNMQVGIDRFVDKGLPCPVSIHDKLMTHSDYVDRLRRLSKEHASTSGIKALPIGKVLYYTLENLFFLVHEVKHIFFTRPNFSKYTDTDEIYRRILKLKLPEDEWWEKMIDVL